MWKSIVTQEFMPSGDRIVADELAQILEAEGSQLNYYYDHYVPNEKQVEMRQIISLAKPSQTCTIIAYGSPGSGKTMGPIAKMVEDLNVYPGTNGLILRRTYSEILGNIILPLKAYLNQYKIEYKLRLDPFPYITFPNNSVLHLRATDKIVKTKDGKADAFGGLELSCALMDEADSIQQEVFVTLRSSRMREKQFPSNYIFLVFNPSSEDAWVFQRFKYLLKHGAGTFSDLRSGVHSIHCPVDCNVQNLPPGYIENMEDELSHNPALFRKFRLGLFGPAVIGKPIFEDLFARDLHVAKGPIKWDKQMPLHRSWDFGWRRPACVVAQEDAETGQIRWLRSDLGNHELLHTYARRQINMHRNLFPGAKWIDYCDIDGRKQNPYSEKSQIQILQGFRLSPLASYTKVEYGLNIMADQLSRNLGSDRRNGKPIPAMLFDPIGARELINAFEFGYTQDTDCSRDEVVPVKDGYYEHMTDAARYLMVNMREMEARSASKNIEKNWKAHKVVRPGVYVTAQEFLGERSKVTRRGSYNFGGGGRHGSS